MIYKNISDAELLEALQLSDQLAMSEIYERYWKKLLAVVYKYVQDKTAAEEIVQEMFIRLWDRRHKLSVESLDKYLSVSVRYMVYNYQCRERRRMRIASEHATWNELQPGDESIYARFLEEHIHNAVEGLPEKCRLVFKYSRYQGLSIREIADHMDISEKTTEAHLTKALKNLRFSLKQIGWFGFLILFFLK